MAVVVPRSTILGFAGLSLGDFQSRDEAFEAADELIRQNMEEYQHAGETKQSKNPLLSKFFYVVAEGKKRTWSQVEVKRLEGTADIKSRKALEESGAFVEGLGSDPSAGGKNVKLENVSYTQMMQAKDALRSSTYKYIYTHRTLGAYSRRDTSRQGGLLQRRPLQNIGGFSLLGELARERSAAKQLQQYPQALQMLRAKMKVKGEKEGVYKKYEEELKQMTEGLDSFLLQCSICIAEAEATPQDDPDDMICKKKIVSLKALCGCTEHHLGGAKAAKSRFSAMC